MLRLDEILGCEHVDLEPGDIHVWLSEPKAHIGSKEWLALERVLDTQERNQLSAFVFEQHRSQYLVAHALLRCILSRYLYRDPTAWKFSRGPYGRPEIEGAFTVPVRFSLSHTDGLVGLAITLERDIGFDLECTTRQADELTVAYRCFAPEEYRALQSVSLDKKRQRFFEFWTLKEAYLKARGFGLSLPLNKFFFEFTVDVPSRFLISADLNDDARVWRFSLSRPTSKHCMAIAVRSIFT